MSSEAPNQEVLGAAPVSRTLPRRSTLLCALVLLAGALLDAASGAARLSLSEGVLLAHHARSGVWRRLFEVQQWLPLWHQIGFGAQLAALALLFIFLRRAPALASAESVDWERRRRGACRLALVLLVLLGAFLYTARRAPWSEIADVKYHWPKVELGDQARERAPVEVREVQIIRKPPGMSDERYETLVEGRDSWYRSHRIFLPSLYGCLLLWFVVRVNALLSGPARSLSS